MKTWMRPTFKISKEGNETLLSIALCTTPGPLLVDEEVLDHFEPNESGADIRKVAAEFHGSTDVDWGQSINVT